jgi:hypothetical protein
MGNRSWRGKKKGHTNPAAHGIFNVLKKLGLTDQARKMRISAAWAQAVGADIASRTEPQSFNRGVLVIKSASAAWQNELTFMKADIIAKVNDALEGRANVKELKVISGTITRRDYEEPPPSWLHEAPTADDLDVARDTSLPIEDLELKKAFERVLLLERRKQRAKRR